MNTLAELVLLLHNEVQKSQDFISKQSINGQPFFTVDVFEMEVPVLLSTKSVKVSKQRLEAIDTDFQFMVIPANFEEQMKVAAKRNTKTIQGKRIEANIQSSYEGKDNAKQLSGKIKICFKPKTNFE